MSSFLRRRDRDSTTPFLGSLDTDSPLSHRSTIGRTQHRNRQAELEAEEDEEDRTPLERRRRRQLELRSRKLGYGSVKYWTKKPRRILYALAMVLVLVGILYGFAIAQKHRVSRGRPVRHY